MARQNGVAVAIGHPYIATIELLERELPKLAGDGIELISISELIALKESRKVATTERSTGAGHGLVR
jgi:polysaccharide deacetylase 2 family uncharacterized protein YibQ